MTDLVTRLRALADTPHPTPQIQRALREAADALDSLQSDRDAHRRCHHDKIIEVCDLKTKLAWWKDRAVKLRYKGRLSVKLASDTMKRNSSEIASLTAKLADVTGKLIDRDLAGIKFREEPNRGSWMERAEKAEAEAAALRELLQVYADATGSYCWGQDDCDAIKAALSQPGPGASYQARMRKLERVLEIANQLGCRIAAEGGHGLPVHALVLDLAEAVAPLKEKP